MTVTKLCSLIPFSLNLAILEEHGRRRPEDDLECEDYVVGGGHDIHEDDMDSIEDDEDIIDDEESGATKYTLRGPTPAAELEAGIMFGRDHKFEVEMAKVMEPSSTLTNMRILNEVHAHDIYNRILEQHSVSALTLRPVSYYDGESQTQVNFELNDTRDQFERVWKSWPVGTSDDEKLHNMMQTIMWEPCDGQHILYACNVIAERAFAEGAITEDVLASTF